MYTSNQVWKAWGRIVARSWLYSQFEERILTNCTEILEAEGISIPSDLEVCVMKSDSDPGAPKPQQMMQLIIPCGVKIKIPEGLEVYLEPQVLEQATESSTSVKLIVSIDIPGVEVKLDRNAKSFKLILWLPPRPMEFTEERIKNSAFGLEELFIFLDDGQRCPQTLNVNEQRL